MAVKLSARILPGRNTTTLTVSPGLKPVCEGDGVTAAAIVFFDDEEPALTPEG